MPHRSLTVHAGGPEAHARRGRAAGAFRAPNALATLAAALVLSLAGLTAAQTPDTVTPELLAEHVPETWFGLAATEVNASFDASGGATASAHYDDEADERSGRDLSLGLTDTGPYRDAVVLVQEADVAAGRAQRTEIAGHPAFAGTDDADPSLDVMAGRIWVRAGSFGELFGPDELREAVEELPLDSIADLADLPVAEGASYDPTTFMRGALRSFLPDSLLGVPRDDGFYAEVHPTGVAWGGYPYVGEVDGREVRLRVGIWDLGTLADASLEWISGATDAWRPFSEGPYPGFVERDAPEPRVVLFVDRFRIEIDAPGVSDVDTAWLQGGFGEIELDRLERLAELVPAPTPAREPLRGQPALIAPERLAEALPAELDGRSRGEIQTEVASSYRTPYDTAMARADYASSEDGEPVWRLAVMDQGLLTYAIQRELAQMRAIDAGDGRTVYAFDERPYVATIVGDRISVTLRAISGEPSAEATERLTAAVTELDLEALAAVDFLEGAALPPSDERTALEEG